VTTTQARRVFGGTHDAPGGRESREKQHPGNQSFTHAPLMPKKGLAGKAGPKKKTDNRRAQKEKTNHGLRSTKKGESCQGEKDWKSSQADKNRGTPKHPPQENKKRGPRKARKKTPCGGTSGRREDPADRRGKENGLKQHKQGNSRPTRKGKRRNSVQS